CDAMGSHFTPASASKVKVEVEKYLSALKEASSCQTDLRYRSIRPSLDR
ncbi:hypothetical protein NPIL_504421, partial [Nephila pilipes]